MEPDAEEALIRRAGDALNRHDVEGVVACVDDSTVWRPSITGGDTVEGGEYVGRDGVRRFFADIDDVWSSFTTHLGELERLDDGRFVGANVIRGVGRVSGVPVEMENWIAIRVVDDHIAHMVACRDHEAAVRAARTEDP